MYQEKYLPWIGQDVIDFINKNLKEEWLVSAGRKIHLDIYPNNEHKPVVVLSHGMAGYGRLLANFAWVLHNRGFNVVLPDLIGYGHNPGPRGHWRWRDLVQNLVDTCSWARDNINPTVYLAGASMGGAIVYHAACHGAPVKAIACYCLFDLTWPDFNRASSRFGSFTPIATACVRKLSKVLPRLPLPATLISSYDKLSNDPHFNKVVQKDPLAGRIMSLGAAAELVSNSLPIPFDQFNKVPILVLTPEEDRMTPAKFSHRAYQQLATPAKRFVSIPGEGHWIIDRKNWVKAFTEVADWFTAQQ